MDSLFGLLPVEIQYRKALRDPILKIWRYDYGRPITGIEGLVQSTSEFPQLSMLYDALLVARARLSDDEQSNWAQCLAQVGKHRDWCEEMLAILNVHDSILADYEPEGLGQDEKKPDWHLRPAEGASLLLEVKHRIVDTVDFFQQVGEQIDAGATRLDDDAIEIDRGPLFRSILEKFRSTDPSTMLQGAWIRTGTKHPDIESHFATLDAERLHFAVLPQQGTVLARTSEQEEHVRRVLGLRT